MIKVLSPRQARLIDEGKTVAALSGPFDPVALVPAGGKVDPLDMVTVVSALAASCDTNAAGGSGIWLMRTPERRQIIGELAARRGLDAALERRVELETSVETLDLVWALKGEAEFSSDALKSRIATADRPEIERIILALDRAGPTAPGYDQLALARTTLAELDRVRRRERLTQAGFVGRKEERRQIADWLAKPFLQPPVKAYFVSGLPGIGKSWLLEEVVRATHDQQPSPLVIRLDFDRAGLTVLDLVWLTMEVARQIGERLGAAGLPLLEERLRTAGTSGGIDESRRSREYVPTTLGIAIGDAVASSGRSVIVILDTLEVLRARGVTHVQRLFEFLDQLMSLGMRPLSVLAAGRGPALDGIPDRQGGTCRLVGLDEPAAMELLAKLDTPLDARKPLFELSEGTPLVLRLGHEVVKDAASHGLPLSRIRKATAAGYLYRFLLSRINDPELRKLANPGLVVRRISIDLIREVLAPLLRLKAYQGEGADAAFTALSSEHWLVVDDPSTPGFVKHRGDMRAALLPLLYRETPGLCARIDKAASDWFGRQTQPWCKLEAVYHRLQYMRRDPKPPPISVDIARQFDEDTIAELPAAAQDHVRRIRGERRAFKGPDKQKVSDDDPHFAEELSAITQRLDLPEGEALLERIDLTCLNPTKLAAEAVRAFYWRAGLWTDARHWLAEHDRLRPGDVDLSDLPPDLAFSRLEMRAEFGLRELVKMFRRNSEFRSVAAGYRHAIKGSEYYGASLALAVVLSSPELNLRADPVLQLLDVAREVWRQDPPSRPMHPGLERQRAVLSRRLAFDPSRSDIDPNEFAARLLAVDNPYQAFATNLTRLTRKQFDIGPVRSIAEGLNARQGLLGEFAVKPGTAVAERPIESIGAVGLFAEWATTTAFFGTHPDLRLIASKAEAWRRTSAGLWSYRSPLPGWPKLRIDHATSARLAAVTAESAETTLRDAVAVWTLAPSPEVAADRLMQRLDRTLTRARKTGERQLRSGKPPERALEETAAVLLRRGIPPTFVAPLTKIILKP